MSGRVVAVCTSAEKGQPKAAVERIELQADHGIRGDAHAGDGHRQVSLLAEEQIDPLRAHGLALPPGAFGENLVVRDFDLGGLGIGDRLRIGRRVELEVTQLGKQCHAPCAIFHALGRCIMPELGVFARVIQGGPAQPGDPVARSGEFA